MFILHGDAVTKLATIGESLLAIEESYRAVASGGFSLPNRVHMHHNAQTQLYMPVFGEKRSSVKLVNVIPENTQRGLPVIQGLMILNEGTTGVPLAVIHGSALTALRTGAVGGLAVKHLSPHNSQSVAIIGAGVQGWHQALFACTVRPIKDLYVYDTARKKQNHLKQQMYRTYPQVSVHCSSSAQQAAEHAQIIICATTSRQPVLPNHPSLFEGKTCLSIGSFTPDMQEFPDAATLTANQIWVDTPHAATESGELTKPLALHKSLSEKIISFEKIFSKDLPEINNSVFFKSVGMALFDLFMANMLYTKAQQSDIAQDIEF